MTSTKQSRSFATYVQKVLKQLHPDGGMTLQAMDAVDFVLRYFTGLFAEKSRRLALRNDTKTISSNEIEAAVKLLFSGEIGKHAISEGKKALTKYSQFETTRESDKQSESGNGEFKAPKTMKQTKAGLIFSVSLVDNSYLRHQGVNVGQGAPVYLAAVLEYLAAEILELAGNVARDNRRTRIKVRDIFIAVENDPELHTLFREHNLVLLGTGVLPHIDQRILESYKKKSAKKTRKTTVSKNTDTNADGKTSHRYRPGTVALRDIHKAQKSTRLMLCKVHIQKACKEITNASSDPSKPVMMSQEARDILHYLVEQKVVEMFAEANEWCLHSGRNTVCVQDLQMAMRNEGVKNGCGENLLFTSPPITSLARRAGIYRMGGDVWTLMKDYIYTLLSRYLNSAMVVLQHQKRQSINLKVLAEALSTRYQVNLCVIPRKIRRTKKSSSETGSQADHDGNGNDDEDHEELDEDVAKDLVNEDELEDDQVTVDEAEEHLDDNEAEEHLDDDEAEEHLDDDETLDDVEKTPTQTPAARSRVQPKKSATTEVKTATAPKAGRKRQTATK